MEIFVKFVNWGKDLMFSQKIRWRARHSMNIVHGKKNSGQNSKIHWFWWNLSFTTSFLFLHVQGFVKKTIFNSSNVTKAEVNEERNWWMWTEVTKQREKSL
jgi:hypothetical protein